MVLPSSLVLSQGRGRFDLLLRTFSPSHPAHVETCALPNDEHRLSKNSMDLVCAFGEHRRSTSPYAPLFLVCRLPRAHGLTRLTPPLISQFDWSGCALREHRSDVRILPPPFWCGVRRAQEINQPSRPSLSGVRVGRAKDAAKERQARAVPAHRVSKGDHSPSIFLSVIEANPGADKTPSAPSVPALTASRPL
jgi:hypothetical protein